MTCITAVTDGKTVWIGGDSSGIAHSSLEIRDDQKVFIKFDKDGNSWAFGFAGSFRMMQVARYHLDLPPLKNLFEEDALGFMVLEFIPRLRRCLTEGGWQTKTNNREETDGSFIVGIKGKIFTVQSDNQVAISHYPFVAVGSGKDLALGALFVSGAMPEEERIRNALEAAESFSTNVRRPFYVVHTFPEKIL